MKLAIFICTVTMFGSFASGKETSGKSNGEKMTMEFTASQRQSMANIHEKMAACLRSERPLSACHQEMMTACKGESGCPMMGGMKGHGMHEHMMEESGKNNE